ncbi:hypothetical protein P3T23_009433 [Paraburkholderia sp. GAS448]|uniref:hypothetical protein n=1 Tax=Paraburkholderia sp. GAS448 TaxID=3035136 RepID=UPI003D25CEEB
MFSGLRRLLGMVRVDESGDQIEVSGLPGDSVAKTIGEVWGTQKIASIMFSRVSPSDIVFNRFFAPDVVYAFNRLIAEKRRGHNIRALKKVVAGIYESTWMKDTLIKHPDILDPAQLNQLKWEPLEHQAGFFRWFNEMVPRFGLHGALLGAGAGTGKAQPLHSLIKTPSGWLTMGEVTVGTEVVTSRGTPTRVTGVYPQGVKDIYRITFRDGRQVECCGDHLWKVHLRHESKSGYWKIRPTREILESTSYPCGRAYVPLIEAEDSIPVDLPVDPYLLGVILGDGCICTGNAVVISNPDIFIREKIQSRLGPDMCICNLAAMNEYNLVGIPVAGRPRFNPLVEKLHQLGLMYRHSHNKVIPQPYLLASRQQRLDLLNGLMDTDGTADKCGSASFLSTSPDLAAGVRYLVRSLGGIASLSVKHKSFTWLGEKKQGRVAYQINIRHRHPEELFSLPRKKTRLDNGNQYAATLKLGIEKIELIGRMPAQCISIADEEGLYVTDGFVVTHNTFMGLALGLQLHADVVIVVCPGRAVKKVWEDTIVTQFKRPQPYWHSQMGKPPGPRMRYYIVHYDAQEKFLAFARTQHWHRPVVVLDESHGMNEIEALRTQLFIALCDLTKSQYILWASGTEYSTPK